MSKLNGKCLCGATVYRCDAEPLRSVICHCQHCQNQTGSSFGVLVVVPRGSLSIEGDMLRTFMDVGETGLPVLRQFCGRCGSPISLRAEKLPEVEFIHAGTLEDTSWVRPAAEVWREQAQAWTKADAGPRTLIERSPQAPLPPDR